MKKPIRTALALLLAFALLLPALVSCAGRKPRVLIYTSMEDYRIEYLNTRLAEAFPGYDVTVEYLPTGNHAARLLAEGAYTDADIIYNLEYSYLEKLDAAGLLANLSDYDRSVYVADVVADGNYLPQERNGGAILINTEVLASRGLAVPTSYADLLRPEYRGLVSMPSPKASGTGYMFLCSLVNAWGEDEAFDYFEALTPNVLQYTSSGAGPLGALLEGEVAVGLGMLAPAVTRIAEGAPIEILFFKEGAPYSLYGQAMGKGKEAHAEVREVFDWLVNTFTGENCERFFPEPIYGDKNFTVEGYPNGILYADMSDDATRKTRLLDRWTY